MCEKNGCVTPCVHCDCEEMSKEDRGILLDFLTSEGSDNPLTSSLINPYAKIERLEAALLDRQARLVAAERDNASYQRVIAGLTAIVNECLEKLKETKK